MGKPSRLFLGPDNLLHILEEELTVAHSALMVVFCNAVASIDNIQPNSAMESSRGV